MTTPLDDLKTAVQAAAGELRNGGAANDRMSLERPKKAGFGDYSTNAAMLLAPVLGEPPRAVAEQLGAALQARVAGGRARRGRRPGLPQPVPGRRLVHRRGRRGARRGRRLRARRGRAQRPGRVRLRQPDRPADGRLGPPRGVRRRARARPRARRPQRPARVLLQRRRRPDPAARRVDPGPRARRGAARGRLPGRPTSPRSRRRSRTPPPRASTSSRPPASRS